MIERNEPFFMVYGYGKEMPTRVHLQFENARDEAHRLARKEAGTAFYILATVGCALKTDVEYRGIDPMAVPF